MNALKSGQSWDTVAKTYAADAAAKANGGAALGCHLGEEESAVNKAIFGNPVNKLVGPVKGIFGYYVLQSTKIDPGDPGVAGRRSTKTIKTDLTSSSRHAADQGHQGRQGGLVHQTTCRSAYAIAAVCPNYKAPKTTTTATSTPTTSSTASTSTKTATTATKTSTTG